MKEKIEQFTKLHTELKQACFNYCNKWHEYQKASGVPFKDWECTTYSYPDINDLNFYYWYYGDDNTGFTIGYEERNCGETEEFNTDIKVHELLDESIIKNKIDMVVKSRLESIAQAEQAKNLATQAREKHDYEEYLRLKSKFENNEK